MKSGPAGRTLTLTAGRRSKGGFHEHPQVVAEAVGTFFLGRMKLAEAVEYAEAPATAPVEATIVPEASAPA